MEIFDSFFVWPSRNWILWLIQLCDRCDHNTIVETVKTRPNRTRKLMLIAQNGRLMKTLESCWKGGFRNSLQKSTNKFIKTTTKFNKKQQFSQKHPNGYTSGPIDAINLLLASTIQFSRIICSLLFLKLFC